MIVNVVILLRFDRYARFSVVNLDSGGDVWKVPDRFQMSKISAKKERHNEKHAYLEF